MSPQFAIPFSSIFVQEFPPSVDCQTPPSLSLMSTNQKYNSLRPGTTLSWPRYIGQLTVAAVGQLVRVRAVGAGWFANRVPLVPPVELETAWERKGAKKLAALALYT